MQLALFLRELYAGLETTRKRQGQISFTGHAFALLPQAVKMPA
ncbi:hypothetical protein [Chitinophaga sedimenti]|nr:hypothetical protein [Chitinophaga sedimenti]